MTGVLHWEATHDMRGLSGWFEAASVVWSRWTVSLLRTALGQEQTLGDFQQATAFGCISGLSPVGRLDAAVRQTRGTHQRSFASVRNDPLQPLCCRAEACLATCSCLSQHLFECSPSLSK